MTDQLVTKLRRLRLGYMAQTLYAHNTESIRHKHSYLEFLTQLLNGELTIWDNKTFHKRVKAARFPIVKTLEEFNFDFQPKLDVKLVKTLAASDYIDRKKNVILLGQPGTGKTHISLPLCLKAVEEDHRVRFSTVQYLAASLRAAHADESVEACIQDFIDPDLVMLDELGFTPPRPPARRSLLPHHRQPLRTGEHHHHQQQVLRIVGRGLPRRRHRQRRLRSPRAPRPPHPPSSATPTA